MKTPVIDGLTACAMFLEVFVIPAAAILSSSSTTATIYGCQSALDKLQE